MNDLQWLYAHAIGLICSLVWMMSNRYLGFAFSLFNLIEFIRHYDCLHRTKIEGE